MSGAQASALLGLTGDGTAVSHEAAASPLVRAVDVVPLAAAEAEWRTFERTAYASPYQRYDWIAACARTIHAQDGSTVVAVLCRETSGKLQAILPLRLTTRFGLRIAQYVGGKHANLNMPLLSAAALSKLDGPAWADILQAAARAHRHIDAFLLLNQPLVWQGQANRITELGTLPAGDDVHMLGLAPDVETKFATLLSKDRRKKLRIKARRLGSLGTLRLTDSGNDAERRLAVASFLRQKADRFRDQGIPDAFAAPEVRDFLLAASSPGANGEAPAIEFHALMAGERVVATIAGAGDARRFSTMCISFDNTPEIARESPGDQILVQMIRHQWDLGRTEFDLGIGEAGYKDIYCDTREKLAHTLFSTSLAGTSFVLMTKAAEAAKRAVKRNPTILRIARRLMRRA